LSCTEPDAAIASELSAAARRAARSGAPAFAAELAAHAVRITPPTDVATRIRRQFVGILFRAAAGERATALADTDALIAMLPPGPARAEAVSLRVGIDFAGGDRYLDQALTEAGSDELLRGRILELRGWMATTYRAELADGIAFCEQALEIAIRLNDPRLEMLAAGSVATASLMLGRPRQDLIDRALRLAEEHPGPALGRWPQGVYGQLCIWCGNLDAARPLLEELYQSCLSAGMEFQRPYRLLDLALLELASGNIVAAADLTEDACESATDASNDQAVAWLAYPAGLAAVHLGEAPRAAEFATVLRSRGTEHDGRTRALMASHVLGLNALAGGDPVAALAALEPGVDAMREIGLQLPSVVPVLPDAIEAAACVGDRVRCDEWAAELRDQARAVGQPWVSAAATRGRGLAALVAGDARAPELLGEAVEMFDRLGYRVDAARTRVHQARAMRRAGQRTAASDVLDGALDGFRQTGASGWLASSHAETFRTAPSGDVPLTPTESRISDLVASGRRNREIAGELAISVATVEAHLTRIYRKLHIRSRTELARNVRSA
jgi:DNA-binding CsgD family transcriptional regulator